MIKLYTIGCPACLVLERKLAAKNIEFEKVDDIELMESKGITSLPKLEMEDGTILDFPEANKWVNNLEEANG